MIQTWLCDDPGLVGGPGIGADSARARPKSRTSICQRPTNPPPQHIIVHVSDMPRACLRDFWLLLRLPDLSQAQTDPRLNTALADVFLHDRLDLQNLGQRLPDSSDWLQRARLLMACLLDNLLLKPAQTPCS